MYVLQLDENYVPVYKPLGIQQQHDRRSAHARDVKCVIQAGHIENPNTADDQVTHTLTPAARMHRDRLVFIISVTM
jgi:hypothetical protein